ncbi:MAG: efflux RND transporter periplasmic adaptor subunit, partial [Haemophilus parahaemolyticus]|nr:efflux RND transporter periplasmic adaptor subunit [Haemophilus parahaemolyticus]
MTTENQKPSRGRKFLIVVTLLVVLVAFAGVAGMQRFIAGKKAEAAANMPETVSEITAMQVQPREWTSYLSAVGYVRPNQGAMLSAESSGTVKSVNVKSGQHVTKGDLLVELDDAVEVATLKASQAQLPNAKLTLDRYRNLVASNSASKAELDSAQATYYQLVANIESLKASIARRNIYAPFSGFAGIVNVNVGQYITTGTEIVRVEDQSSMKV